MDMVVRWLSTANALQRSLVLQTYICDFFNVHSTDFQHQLRPAEWRALRGIHAVIEFGRGASCSFQSETVVLGSIAFITMLLFAEHHDALDVDRILSAADPTKWEDVKHASLHPEANRVGKALHRDLKRRFCASKVNMAMRSWQWCLIHAPRTWMRVGVHPLQVRRRKSGRSRLSLHTR